MKVQSKPVTVDYGADDSAMQAQIKMAKPISWRNCPLKKWPLGTFILSSLSNVDLL